MSSFFSCINSVENYGISKIEDMIGRI